MCDRKDIQPVNICDASIPKGSLLEQDEENQGDPGSLGKQLLK